MNRAHDYFREKGYRFILLGTSPALVAHSLYQKLGYTDAVEYPSAYKVVREKPRNSRVEGLISAFEPRKMLNIYNKAMKGMTGLVVRDIAYLRMLRRIEGIKPKQCLLGDGGYVIFREDKSATCVRELVTADKRETEKLVVAIEQLPKAIVYNRVIMDKHLLEVYRSRGYFIQEKGYAVMMCKSLTVGASFTQDYGEKFFLTRLDSF
jgi:predicted acetyltransferase